MENDSYPKTELDLMLRAIVKEQKDNHREVMLAMADQKIEQKKVHTELATAVEKVDAKITFTNGKVKKINIGLVAVGAYAVGMGQTNLVTLIKIFL